MAPVVLAYSTVVSAVIAVTTEQLQVGVTFVGVVSAAAVGILLQRIGAKQKRIAAMDAYLKLDARLTAPSVLRARSDLSASYLRCEDPPTNHDRDDVAFVMTQFEGIAYAVHKKLIDKEMV